MLNLSHMKQQYSLAMLMLLLACLMGLAQISSLNADSYHLDASASASALEFEIEESAGDYPVTPEHAELTEAQYVLSETLLLTPHQADLKSLSYTTPHTRAPPLV
ncbi:hypothetical protein [Alteromonas gilva]|uniref:Uncharacterized protein n=1 Tax=Alteromonas gilva TaxID=2987522 RepID=A0ABT5L214_9ALTE|nr:hypothetical protein [Alteromonas gilva]MDC8830516.1 hypothetical protein [Alteromonas gilva]